MPDTQLRRIDDGGFAQRQNSKPHIREIRVLLTQFFVKQHIRHRELVIQRKYFLKDTTCHHIDKDVGITD